MREDLVYRNKSHCMALILNKTWLIFILYRIQSIKIIGYVEHIKNIFRYCDHLKTVG